MRRLVQVVCWDADKRVKASKALIYRSEPFLTDALDGDVLMASAIEIQKALDTYNESVRRWVCAVETSKAIGRATGLDPLDMADVVKKVVTIA